MRKNHWLSLLSVFAVFGAGLFGYGGFSTTLRGSTVDGDLSTSIQDDIVELNPDLQYALIKFEPATAVYPYTGDPVCPVFSVLLNSIVDSSEYTCRVISTDEPVKGTSAGTNAGTVTLEITGNGDISNGYYGTTTATYTIQKATGLKAMDAVLRCKGAPAVFQLQSIALNKADAGICTCSLSKLEDEDQILSDVSFQEGQLLFTPSGVAGTATQWLTIHSQNYEDAEVSISVTCAGRIAGDCDSDGAVQIADAIMLQKWLMCDGVLADWKAADINGDGTVNALDLTALKQRLFQAIDKMQPTVTGSSEVSDDLKKWLVQAVCAENPSYNFAKYTFDCQHALPILDTTGKQCGKSFLFNAYCDGVLLNEDTYTITVNSFDDGTFTMMGQEWLQNALPEK